VHSTPYVTGDWAVLDNLKSVLGRDPLPFIDDPYRDIFNCGGRDFLGIGADPTYVCSVCG